MPRFTVPFRRKMLFQALTLALLTGNAQPVWAINAWTGNVSRDFDDPANWTGNVLPPSGGAGGSNNAVLINLASGNTPLIERADIYPLPPRVDLGYGLLVGHGAGKSGKLDIQVPALANNNMPFNDPSSHVDPELLLAAQQPRFRVGDQGGMGTVVIDVSADLDAGHMSSSGRVGFSGTGLGLGLGAAGNGTLEVLGAGKEIWHNGPRSPYSVLFNWAVTHSLIGDGGGTGKVKIDGAGLVLETGSNNYPWSSNPWNYLKIGDGADSVGTVEVFGSGKFSAESLTGSDRIHDFDASNHPFTYLGLGGGTGRVTVSDEMKSTGKIRNQANFPTGLRVGSTGGTGALDVLAGGKAQFSNGLVYAPTGTCAATQGQSPFPAALQISPDGAAEGSHGTVRVDGVGAELMISGAYNDYWNLPMTATADTVGRIQIGTGGALVLANGGIAKVGLTPLEYKHTLLTSGDEADYGEFIPVGGLGTVEVDDAGRVVYGALPGETPQAAGEVQAAWIHLNSADAAVVFNHTGSLDFDRALGGAGKVVQVAGATTVSATLASKPQPDTAIWGYDTDAACRPPVADDPYPSDQGAFTGTLDVQGGTLVLPASGVLAHTTATTISGGTLMQGGTMQNLGEVGMTGGTLQLTGGATPGATDVAHATSWTGAGGTVWLDTVLGADGNPSDRLVISGAVSGTTFLRINNLGGTGAQTTGNGILVVEATGGPYDAGSFMLTPSVYDNGYTYTLKQQGDGNWYLVSQKGSPPVAGTAQPIPALPLPALAALGGLLTLWGAGTLWRRRQQDTTQ